MLPVLGGAGPLEQLGQEGEDRRRVAPGGRGLAGRQPDLALGHGEAGQGVHHQDDVLALVAEPLGDPGGGEGGPDADEGRLVGRGHDHHRAGQALGSEVALDELVDLAAALADQGDHRHRGVGAPGDHGEKARLAHPGAGEDAQPLAPTAGDEGVDGLDARGPAGGRPARGAADGGAPSRSPTSSDSDSGGAVVDGPAQTVEDATEQALADPHGQRAPEGLDGVAEAHPGQVAEGHAGQGRRRPRPPPRRRGPRRRARSAPLRPRRRRRPRPRSGARPGG